jgi:prepilin-type N-terminal cleavage/methylation domain-containing protein
LARPRTLSCGASGSEAGFSLIEILITITIVGVTFTALLGGMLVSITSSALHRKEATADSVARDAAEWVKDSVQNPYRPCNASYSLNGFTVPSGFSASITGVEYWNGTPPTGGAYSPTFSSSCPSSDHGLERITVRATSSDGQATETVQVLKRVVT